jgi:hypothetical protein
MTAPTATQLIDAYVKVRDRKEELAKRQKQEMEPLNTMLVKLEAGLIMALDATGGDSIKGTAGTVYRRVFTSVKTDDWDVVLPWVLENNLEHMLEKRLNKTAVQEYIDANGEAPPGIAIVQENTIGVRRPSSK